MWGLYHVAIWPITLISSYTLRMLKFNHALCLAFEPLAVNNYNCLLINTLFFG